MGLYLKYLHDIKILLSQRQLFYRLQHGSENPYQWSQSILLQCTEVMVPQIDSSVADKPWFLQHTTQLCSSQETLVGISSQCSDPLTGSEIQVEVCRDE